MANKGHIVSMETREKLRLANLGKQHTPESKEKNRDNLIDKCLNEMNIKIIRFWEHDIMNNRIDLETINKEVMGHF